MSSYLLFKIYFDWSKKHINAIFPIDLIENKQFILGISSNFIFRILFGGVIFTCSYVMQIQLGYTLIKTALCLSLYGAGMILGKPFVELIISNYGHKKTLIFNSIFLFVLTISVTVELAINLFYTLYSTLFFYGLSATLQYSAMNITSLNELKPSLHSKANVALNITRLLGVNFGISLAALIFELKIFTTYLASLVILLLFSTTGFFGAWLFKKMNIE